jgi:hypothetical protein
VFPGAWQGNKREKQTTAPKGQGEEKMATIEDVVLMWNGNAEYSKIGNVETLSENVVLPHNDARLDKKIMRGHAGSHYNKQAVIRLSKEYPFEPWSKRICYAFFFSFSEQTDELINIRVSFESRINNTPEFCDFVKKLDKEKINGQPLAFRKRTGSENFILGADLSNKSSVQDICEAMKQLITKTQKDIISQINAPNTQNAQNIPNIPNAPKAPKAEKTNRTKPKYQIFISSTFDDLQKERNAIIKAIWEMGNIPAGMESFAASDDEQFEYIKKIIDDSDYYVLILAGRYGAVHPEKNLSYTELEYEYAQSKNIPILSFLHKKPGDLPEGKRQDEYKEELKAFIKKVSNARMCKKWDTIEELSSSIITSLNNEINNNPQKGWIRGT